MYETVSYSFWVTTTSRSRMTPERQAEVLAAVLELVREVGYERLTYDAVAARAHTSKATLYRLWPDKPRLVVAAIESHQPAEDAFVPTDSLAGDLAQLDRGGRRRHRKERAELEMMFGLLRAAVLDVEFGAVVRQRIIEPALADLIAIFTRAVERGEIEDDPRLFRRLAESLVECVLFAALIAPVQSTQLTEHIEVLVKPALTYRRP